MLKKLSIFLLIILLLSGLTVPAFASSTAGSNVNSNYQAAVQVDYLKYLNGSYAGAVCDWPNNTASVGGSYVYGDVGDGLFTFDAASNSSVFTTTFYPGTCNYVELFCSSYFWYGEQHFLLSTENSVGSFESVSISGKAVVISASGDQYYWSTRNFSVHVSVYADQIYVDDLIGDAVADYVNDQSGVAYLTDVSIKVSLAEDTNHFSAVIAIGEPGKIDTWFNYLNLKFELTSPPSGLPLPGMFDWLLDSVNAFLNFEIAPNFTLNYVFYLVLVVGILLWFLTLLI